MNTPRTPRPAAATRPIPALEHAARALLVGSAVLAPVLARLLPDAGCLEPEYPRAGLFNRMERAGVFRPQTDPADTRADECPALADPWLAPPRPPPPSEQPIVMPPEPPPSVAPSPPPPAIRPHPARPPLPPRPVPPRQREMILGEMGLVTLAPLARRRRRDDTPATRAGACTPAGDEGRG